MHYTISETSLQTRKNNVFLGALFSLGLAVVEKPDPERRERADSPPRARRVGNLVNYYHYRRYLRRVENHRIEIAIDKISFITGSEKSVLDSKDIVALTFYRRKGQIAHIQLKLRNNRGIRLEGYTGLEQLGGAIADMIPGEQVIGRKNGCLMASGPG